MKEERAIVEFMSLIRQTERKRKKEEKKGERGSEKKAIEMKEQKRVRKTSTHRVMRSRRSIKSSIDSHPFVNSLPRSLAYRAPHARQFSAKRRKKGRKVHTTGRRRRRSCVAASHVPGCWIFYADDALAHLSIVYISSTRQTISKFYAREHRAPTSRKTLRSCLISNVVSNKFKSIRAGNCCFREE